MTAAACLLAYLWSLAPLIPLALAAVAILTVGYLMTRRPEILERIYEWSRPRMLGTRRAIKYRYGWIMALEDAGIVPKAASVAPMLLRIRSLWNLDILTVKLAGGLTPDDFVGEDATHRKSLAKSFGVKECRVWELPDRQPPRWLQTPPPWWPPRRLTWLRRRLAWLRRPLLKLWPTSNVKRIELWMITHDALAGADNLVPPYEVSESLPAAGLPLGKREDGRPFLLLYTHLLLVGATRSGKTSMIWALILALYKALKVGDAVLWVIDPKRELGIGRHLYKHYANKGSRSYRRLLLDAVAELERRQKILDDLGEPTWFKGMRDNTGAVIPQLWLIVDEILAVTTLISDPKLRRRMEDALMLLLTQGAAAGIYVVGATQNPEKRLLKMRDEFVNRVCFRVPNATYVRMALSGKAYDNGADAERIPFENDRTDGLYRWRGLAFHVEEGSDNVTKIRGTGATKKHIKALPPLYGWDAPAKPKDGGHTGKDTPKLEPQTTYEDTLDTDYGFGYGDPDEPIDEDPEPNLEAEPDPDELDELEETSQFGFGAESPHKALR